MNTNHRTPAELKIALDAIVEELKALDAAAIADAELVPFVKSVQSVGAYVAAADLIGAQGLRREQAADQRRGHVAGAEHVELRLQPAHLARLRALHPHEIRFTPEGPSCELDAATLARRPLLEPGAWPVSLEALAEPSPRRPIVVSQQQESGR